MHTRQKLVLLGTLYLSQGLPFGFLTQAVPVLLREEGASLTTIGDTSLLMAPWLFKFLWAPYVDRHWWPALGRRKSWILPLQGLTIATLLGLALANPTDTIPVLLAATFVTAILAATQDIATDGLAVSMLAPSERGLGNGIQVAGYRLGMVVGGGALLVVFARAGWLASFLGMATMLVLATVPVARWTEPVEAGDGEGAAQTVRQLVSRPGMAVWLGLLVAYKLGEQLGGAVTKPMLVDLGLKLDTIGGLAAVDSVASLFGALVGGWLTGRMHRRTALVGFGVLQATGVAAWILPALGVVGLWGLAGVKVYDGFVGSMATAALFTAMMDASRPESGGMDYTLQASVVLVAAFLGSMVGGRGADLLIGLFATQGSGYAVHFALSALLTVGGALLVGSSGLRALRREE